MSIKEQILKHVSNTSSTPFLFVGSGLSLRYLGLETWIGLLSKFATKTGVPFEMYSSSVNGKLPLVATHLANDFFDVWWKSDEYAASRKANKVRRRDSPLKVEIAQYMRDASARAVPEDLKHEVKLLQSVTVDGIITTNWDTFLEQLFPGYETFIGQDHLLFSHPQSIAEIYKIHGSCTEPESMVLTEEDYDRFNSRNAYLAAKLMTVFVEHPVVFLGYSFSDPHIVQIIEAIAGCLTSEHLNKLIGGLIFVEYDRDSLGDEVTTRQIKGLYLTVVRTRNFSQVYEALASKPRQIPAKMLRKVKEHLYHLVRTHDPSVERYVRSFEEIERADAGPETYAGFGKVNEGAGELGYKRIKMIDILRDVALSRSSLDANSLLALTFPDLLRQAKWVPVFKYLRAAQRVVNGIIDTTGLDRRVCELAMRVEHAHYLPSGKWSEKKIGDVLRCGSVGKVREVFGDEKAMQFVTCLPREMVDIKELELFLRQSEAAISGGGSNQQTTFARLVCFYDWLVFAPQPPAP